VIRSRPPDVTSRVITSFAISPWMRPIIGKGGAHCEASFIMLRPRRQASVMSVLTPLDMTPRMFIRLMGCLTEEES
jgi:hypothetical protein